MKNHLLHLAFLALIALSACNPRVSTTITSTRPVISYDEEVVVLDLTAPIPDDAERLGSVKVGDTGFTTNCSYAVVLDCAIAAVRKAGGNMLKITEHRQPTALGSACHRIEGIIFWVADPQSMAETIAADTLSDLDYAVLYVVRPPGLGAMISYNLNLGKQELCNVKNNSKQQIIIREEGRNTLWAQTEVKREIPIDIVFGKSYYVGCSLKMGIAVGRPYIELLPFGQSGGAGNFTGQATITLTDGTTFKNVNIIQDDVLKVSCKLEGGYSVEEILKSEIRFIEYK